MSERWDCKDFDDEHLMAIAEHAREQKEMWEKRMNIALGHLASRGLIELED